MPAGQITYCSHHQVQGHADQTRHTLTDVTRRNGVLREHLEAEGILAEGTPAPAGAEEFIKRLRAALEDSTSISESPRSPTINDAANENAPSGGTSTDNVLRETAATTQPELEASSLPTSRFATADPPPSVPTFTPAPVSLPSPSTSSIQNPGNLDSPNAQSRNRLTQEPVGDLVSADTLVSNAQQSQRADYIKMQKEREQKQRDERERIKQQIKSDREERRRRDELRKQPPPHSAHPFQSGGSTRSPPKTSDVRVQVRTFDGSNLRQTFSPTATITSAVRPWIDAEVSESAPYNLKLILTPLPNRNIEAAEEEQFLTDLGIRGSCTFVMVPVKGYVESYTGSTAGSLVGSAVSGGYNLVSSTAGAVVGGVQSLLGWAGGGQEQVQPDGVREIPANGDMPERPGPSQVRVRTLADQRAEAAKKKDQQFYNGNQLNFEPRKDEGKDD